MKKLFLAAAAMAAVTAATPAFAQATTPVGATTKPSTNARLIKPLTLERVTDLNFGTIVMGTLANPETVSIAAAAGTPAIVCGSSGQLACSGARSAAQYRVTGTQGQTVNVTSVQATYPLTGSNGGTLTFTPSFPSTVQVDNSGNPGKLFEVGGSIVVSPTTPDGVYTGSIDIQVAYQ